MCSSNGVDYYFLKCISLKENVKQANNFKEFLLNSFFVKPFVIK